MTKNKTEMPMEIWAGYFHKDGIALTTDGWNIHEHGTKYIRADIADEVAEALDLILKTHDFSCKGEECQISGIDVGKHLIAKYKSVLGGR